MRGIPEDKAVEIGEQIDSCKYLEGSVKEWLRDECQELNPWMTLEEFLKSGFVGKCWIFTEGIVLETEFDLNGFWYAFKYIENNKITHVMPIHKPDAPKE